jgi:predicted Mrr-cat superfamily restriction endonuclease
MKNVWRLITQREHKDEALAWCRENSRISVGWNKIGDIRKQGYRSADDIGAAIRKAYPQGHDSGGPSLWNFYSEIQIGDLVILSAGRPRVFVVEINGEYEYIEGPRSHGIPYSHQRSTLVSGWKPEELWQKAGGGAAGQNIRWTLIRCANQV